MLRSEDSHDPFTYSLCLYEEGRKGTFGETDASCYPDTEKVTCPGPPPPSASPSPPPTASPLALIHI